MSLTSVGFTNYSPALKGVTGDGTIGNGVLEGYHRILDGWMDLTIYCKFGSTTTYANGIWYWEIPASKEFGVDPGFAQARVSCGQIYVFDTGLTLRGGLVVLDYDDPTRLLMMSPLTAGNFWSSGNPQVFTTGDVIGLTARFPVTDP